MISKELDNLLKELEKWEKNNSVKVTMNYKGVMKELKTIKNLKAKQILTASFNPSEETCPCCGRDL